MQFYNCVIQEKHRIHVERRVEVKRLLSFEDVQRSALAVSSPFWNSDSRGYMRVKVMNVKMADLVIVCR